MKKPRIQNTVLNPCPKCGKRFDCMGCMTFVDGFLLDLHDGKCPDCGTRVVVQVEDGYHSGAWQKAETLAQIRAFRIAELELSVRTERSLDQLGICTVGDLLDTPEERIREAFKMAEPVLKEIRQLLSEKSLSLAKR